MVLNGKKGSAIGIFFLMMIGIVMFILGFALAPAFKSSSDNARTNLDCNNASISVDQKVTCGVVDTSTPFLTGIIFALAGIVFGARLVI